MARCATLSPLAGPSETMVGTVDCFLQTNVQAAYAGLSGGGFAYALTIALTLYVAIVGYRLILGRSGLSVGEMAPRMLLIGALLALTSSWGTYQLLVYDVLTDGPEEIAAMINPGSGSQAGLTQRIDVLSARLVDLADAWTEFDARVGLDVPTSTPTPIAAPAAAAQPLPTLPSGVSAIVGPRDSLGPNMLLISALLLILGSAGVLVVAKIILGLLLMVGPVFALLALFASTRGLALGWGRAAVMMALVPLMAMMTSAGAVALLEPMLTRMIVGAGQGLFSLSAALSIMVVVILMLVVAVQMFRIGRTIVGGWTLPIGQQATVLPNMSADAMLSVQTQSAVPVFNERIQSLVGSIERATLASPATVTASMQRAILLPVRADVALGQSRGDSVNPDRRIAGTRMGVQRAPIKPFRSAA